MSSRTFVISLFIGILFTLLSTSLFAQSVGVVNARLAKVMAEPNAKSEILLNLRKGQKLDVLSQQGSFYKVRVKVDNNFTFDGWMAKKEVKLQKTGVVKRTPTKQMPKQVTKSQRRPSTPPQMAPTRSSRRSTVIEEDRRSFDGGRGDASVRLGYHIYNYAVSTGGTAPGAIFSYNLPGIGVTLAGKYWFMQTMGGKLNLGGALSYEHVFYRHTTNLQDSTATTFSEVSTMSSSYDFKGSILARYLANAGVFHSVTLGVGYEYFKFNGDDIESNAGPLNLYTSQTMGSVFTGLSARFYFPGVGLTTDLGGDVLIINSTSESPASATGSDPSGKMGYVPRISFGYQMGERHNLSLGYSLRMQKTNFTGAGTRVGSAVTDGEVSIKSHQLALGYSYAF